MSTNTNRLLAAVIVLQVLTLAGSWGASYVGTAKADLPPDPAAMRLQQTEELKAMNQKLERMVAILEGGRLEVRVSNLGEANKNNGNGAGNAKK